MQTRYLLNLICQKIVFFDLFNLLVEKQVYYYSDLQHLLNKTIKLNNFIYVNYFISFLNNTYMFDYEKIFDLFAEFSMFYPHLFTFYSYPYSVLNWQNFCFFFNDKLIYSDVLIKYIQYN